MKAVRRLSRCVVEITPAKAMSSALCFIIFVIIAGSAPVRAAPDKTSPNFVVIFCDDLGYGDLGCYGHPTIRTPQLDRMAREGMKLTQFYSAACVCTPSRAALLTGRLPIRNGMSSDRRRVLFPDSKGGIQADEVTIAEALKAKGYRTACVGKWHLGHLPEFLPTRHGFDEYFGIPYSNDMDRVSSAPRGREAFHKPKVEYWNVPLMRGEKVVERPADQPLLTRRYTEEAVEFIKKNKDEPFFLYLAHSMPHVPLFRSTEFRGQSLRGLYGDVIEEIDWSVGQVLETLRREGLDRRTLVVFTSDNGPWLTFGRQGGSAGLLRDGKGSTWEGGMREPTIAWWPGRVPAASVQPGMASTLDLLPTFLALAGAPPPADRVLDGFDLSKLLEGSSESPRDHMFFYRGRQIFAVRKGPFKAHFITKSSYGGEPAKTQDPPLLYNLETDPSETDDVAAHHPDIVAAIEELKNAHAGSFVPPPSQLELR